VGRLIEALSLTLSALCAIKGVVEWGSGVAVFLPWFALAASLLAVFAAAYTHTHDPPRPGAWRGTRR
jgi:hypothetical protein